MQTSGKVVIIGLLLLGLGAMGLAGYLPYSIKQEREAHRVTAEQERYEREQALIDAERKLREQREDSARFQLLAVNPDGEYRVVCAITANTRDNTENFSFFVERACIPLGEHGEFGEIKVMPVGGLVERVLYRATVTDSFDEAGTPMARVTANLADISAKVFPQRRAVQTASAK